MHIFHGLQWKQIMRSFTACKLSRFFIFSGKYEIIITLSMLFFCGLQMLTLEVFDAFFFCTVWDQIVDFSALLHSPEYWKSAISH